MKKINLFVCLIATISILGQEKKPNKNAKVSFKVDGVCMMCKNRIETSALKTKGVKFAFWNGTSKELQLIIDERKTSVATTQQNILDAGHDILLEKEETKKATDEAYSSVAPCCKYRDEDVVKSHN